MRVTDLPSDEDFEPGEDNESSGSHYVSNVEEHTEASDLGEMDRE